MVEVTVVVVSVVRMVDVAAVEMVSEVPKVRVIDVVVDEVEVVVDVGVTVRLVAVRVVKAVVVVSEVLAGTVATSEQADERIEQSKSFRGRGVMVGRPAALRRWAPPDAGGGGHGGGRRGGDRGERRRGGGRRRLGDGGELGAHGRGGLGGVARRDGLRRGGIGGRDDNLRRGGHGEAEQRRAERLQAFSDGLLGGGDEVGRRGRCGGRGAGGRAVIIRSLDDQIEADALRRTGGFRDEDRRRRWMLRADEESIALSVLALHSKGVAVETESGIDGTVRRVRSIEEFCSLVRGDVAEGSAGRACIDGKRSLTASSSRRGSAIEVDQLAFLIHQIALGVDAEFGALLDAADHDLATALKDSQVVQFMVGR